MANDVTVQGAAYGGMTPSGVVGADEFATHDPINSWQDQGEAEALANQVADHLVAELAAYGADQVKKAILDWFTNAPADLEMVADEQCITIDASTDAAAFAVIYQLIRLWDQGHAQAFTAQDDALPLGSISLWTRAAKNLYQLAEQHGNRRILQALDAMVLDLQSSFRGAPTAPAPTPHQRVGRNGRPTVQGHIRGAPVQRGPHQPTGTGRAPATGTQQGRRSPDPQIAGAEPHRPSRRGRGLPAPQAAE